MIEYPLVLQKLYPDAEWTLNGETYDGLIWHSDTPKPSQKSLDDAWPQVQYDRAVASIRAERETRYRAETDPMFMKVQRDEGGTLAEWKAAVEQIRLDLPYPPQPDA